MAAGEVGAAPEFLEGGGVEAGGAVAAEVEVDAAGFEEAGAGGVGVEGVAEGFGVFAGEEFDLVEDFAGGALEAVGPEFAAVFGGGGEPDLVVEDEGGGPALVGDGGFPEDVFGVGPGEGEVCGFGLAVAVGAAELVPAWGGVGGGEEGEGEGEGEDAGGEVHVRR